MSNENPYVVAPQEVKPAEPKPAAAKKERALRTLRGIRTLRTRQVRANAVRIRPSQCADGTAARRPVSLRRPIRSSKGSRDSRASPQRSPVPVTSTGMGERLVMASASVLKEGTGGVTS